MSLEDMYTIGPKLALQNMESNGGKLTTDKVTIKTQAPQFYLGGLTHTIINKHTSSPSIALLRQAQHDNGKRNILIRFFTV